MEQDSKRGRNMKVCLVGSSGGHLTHLYMLKPFWENKKRFWVTFDKEDAKSMLKGEKVYPCYFPTNRNIKNLIKNTFVALRVLRSCDIIRGSSCSAIFLYCKINGKEINLY